MGVPTSDGPPGEWPLDAVAEREIAACRPHLTPERAMALIVENNRLRRENADLKARVTELESRRMYADVGAPCGR